MLELEQDASKIKWDLFSFPLASSLQLSLVRKVKAKDWTIKVVISSFPLALTFQHPLVIDDSLPSGPATYYNT